MMIKEEATSENNHHKMILEAAVADDVEVLVQGDHADHVKLFRDKHGSSLLHYAAGSGSLRVCRWFLKSPRMLPADIAAKNGRTPLHWAARNGHMEVCQFLVLSGCTVDVLAKGEVTPLQLAVWQGQVSMCQLLVSMGANPHFVNGWGCGTAHWLGKCPEYGDAENMRRMCSWLFEECQVPHNEPNHHGQTPLHKASFEGNLPVLDYLVFDKGVLDTLVDHQGNTAADCAERNHQQDAAVWLRRHASPLLYNALKTLKLSPEKKRDRANTTLLVPPIAELRRRYLNLARRIHPDRSTAIEACRKSFDWSQLQQAHELLVNWYNSPRHYDVTIRLATRNQALQERPAITWLPQWHEHQQACESLTTATLSSDEELAIFEQRLVSLLLTDAYRINGLSLAQLPKEMKKTWNTAINPKDYKCRKWVDLLKRKCSETIHVEVGKNSTTQSKSSSGTKQPLIFAKAALPKT